MDVLKKQAYDAHAHFLGTKILSWVDEKPRNRTLRNVLQALKFMLQYTVSLEMELTLNDFEIRKIKNENLKLKKELVELKEKYE